ncbi:energy transducer TonB [Mucilaginibacter sp. UYCu711]|uniref:energy transducer TonB n=1 Tax=Mucilaginibacter sp. UYCu711 TaxID=3156339 RepID=UPI003D209347
MRRSFNRYYRLLTKYCLVALLFSIVAINTCKADDRISTFKPALLSDTIYSKVDKAPTFPGGIEFLFQFIGNNIKYRDAEDFDDPKQRRVLVQFIVEPDGLLSGIKAIRGTNDSLNREAERVIALSQKWEPGIKDGKAVRVRCAMPVAFGRGELHDSYSDEIFPEVTRDPRFPGGPDAFNKFISEHIRYPKDDRDKGISGKAVVQFVVEKNGSLSNFKALSGPSEAMKAEAVRLMALSPKWYAGIWEGNKFVRTQYTASVIFTLDH